MELQSQLGVEVPSQSRANYSSAKEIETGLVVAHHDTEVFGYVIEQNFQWVFRPQLLLGTKDSILKRSSVGHGEILGIPRADKLQNHLHEFFASQFRSREMIEHRESVFST